MSHRTAEPAGGLRFDDRRTEALFRKSGGSLDKVLMLRRLFEYDKPVEVKTADGFLRAGLPRWAVAANRPGTILVLSYETNRDRFADEPWRIIVHELVHVIINEKTGGTCPLWLNEGIAQHYAGQTGRYRNRSPRSGGKNIYDMEYRDDGFYALCGITFASIAADHDEKGLIGRLAGPQDFENDPIFGRAAVARLFRQPLPPDKTGSDHRNIMLRVESIKSSH